jgi:PAS domain S-box-containing protein
LFPPEDAARLMAVKRHAIETRARTREELCVAFRGEQRLFDLTVEPRIGAGGAVEGITCAAYDVTELRRAEAGMRESEQRLRVAAHAAELGVYEWDLRSSKAHWENERMFEILGRRESDGPLGTAAFLEIVHPDDRQELGNRMARAMKLNEQLHALVRIRRCDDNETRWVELRGAFQIDQIRVPVGLFGVMADVTDREHAAEQLRQAMNVKDEFLGLVSHELRTPMTLVLGFAQSLERRVEGADGDTRKTAHDLVVEAEWLRALIENMLVLARLDQEQPTMELFDGRQVMRHVVELHRSRFPEREIEVELGAGVLMGEVESPGLSWCCRTSSPTRRSTPPRTHP